MPLRAGLSALLNSSRESLLAEKTENGFWEGELSTSALSTATAIVALASVDRDGFSELVSGGVSWLARNQNADGGWGDTTKSFSNISTTLLCWSALSWLGDESHADSVSRASSWVREYCGSLDPELMAETVKARYGKDRTFSVPILMLCAICGTLGKRGWQYVLPLPFELAAFPREWFAILRLPVVSYALPALIAIGHARFSLAPPLLLNPLRWIRRKIWPRVSRLLCEIQPENGGFLEAAPLTSFVTMALASSGDQDHPVAKKGVEFLASTVRSDGSWPIDTNLATWATTLSTKALALSDTFSNTGLSLAERKQILEWLLSQQYRSVHPFTNSPPGGWAWTDLPGGVPDADDTPGAMLALHYLSDDESFEECLAAVSASSRWLLGLQNSDGGIPTFCRGWGALPFDRSSPDLTAHTLRAWACWMHHLPEEVQSELKTATESGIRFLRDTQNPDGSWTPLWFGNQHRRRDEENPTYGTAMVVMALEELQSDWTVETLKEKGIDWLRSQQNADGGWGAGIGTPSSIEETALALSAISCSCHGDSQIIEAGVAHLEKATDGGKQFPTSPIGFYFAKLWYHERIYPLVWTVEALGRIARK